MWFRVFRVPFFEEQVRFRVLENSFLQKSFFWVCKAPSEKGGLRVFRVPCCKVPCKGALAGLV